MKKEQKKTVFIILEGIDKSGKSTLARYLSKELNIPIYKFSQPKEDPYNEYYQFLIKTNKSHILDRFYLGELVYGPVFRGKSGLNSSHVKVIEQTCKNKRTINIYTSNTPEIIKERFEKEKETFVKSEQVETILKNYEESVNNSTMEWIRYTGNSEQDLKDILVKVKAKL